MRYFTLLLVGLIAACSSNSTGFDHDPTHDFSKPLTVMVAASSQQVMGLDGERIAKALLDGANARGWSTGPNSTATFQFGLRSKGKNSGSNMSIGIGAGRYSRSGVSVGGSVSVPVGGGREAAVLEVVLIDDATGKTLWFGTENWSVKQSASPAERNDAIRLIVAKLMQTIPR